MKSQGGNSTNQAICGTLIGTVENSETLALVVGLIIMFVLVIYSRLVTTAFPVIPVKVSKS